MTDLESQFHLAMLGIYDEATRLKPPYYPTYFKRMVQELGGVGAAQSLLSTKEVSAGFNELFLRGKRLDLSVEHLVLRHPWRGLFSDADLDIARQRLNAVQYPIPE